MATQFSSSLNEGQSTNRPLLFNGANYIYWKARMKIFIQALDYNLWILIVNGPYIPTHTINNIVILKSEVDWDDHDKKKMAQLNAKVVNILYCTLDVNEINRIFICTSAKKN